MFQFLEKMFSIVLNLLFFFIVYGSPFRCLEQKSLFTKCFSPANDDVLFDILNGIILGKWWEKYHLGSFVNARNS